MHIIGGAKICIFNIYRMQKIYLTFILFFLPSCNVLPESKGLANEIVVIISPEDRMYAEPILSEVFSKIIHTPQPEPVLNLMYKNPWELESVKNYSNILYISLIYPQDSTGDILYRRISEQYNQNAQIFTLVDLYSRDQLFTLIYAKDAIELEKILMDNQKYLLDEIQSLFDEKMIELVYKNGKNHGLSSSINQLIGYTLDLQIDYQLIKSDSLSSFIWVGRGYPYRWITLHKSRKDNFKNPIMAWKNLTLDYSKNMPEIIISEYYQANETAVIQDKKIPLMRGVYEHAESDSGGPFFVYIFETDYQNEVILVSGFLNHPGHEKIFLLKQLETIAKTIHKGDPS